MEIAYLLDMDGVLVRGGTPVEGSADFVGALVESMRAFQIFTNNSRYTPEDHVHRLRKMGFPVEPHHIYTSALATARFISERLPGASVYAIGDQGLMSALQQWAGEVEDLFGVSCRFHCFAPVLIHDDTVATHLYYIAREAVNNAIKHGGASQIVIHLAADQEQGMLTITDNGSGITEILANNAGMGRHLMSYRARVIGGSLEIQRVAAGGTVVTCLFPVQLQAGELSRQAKFEEPSNTE